MPSEDRLDKIEKIIESIANTTVENTNGLEELEIKIAENIDRLGKVEIKIGEIEIIMNENHLECRSDIRRLEKKIGGTLEEVDQTYGSTSNDILDRLAKLEQKVAST